MATSKVLTPLAHEKFFNNYWESQPLHIERSDSGYFESLLSEAMLLEFVQTGAVSFPEVQAINARAPVPVADYTTDKKTVNAEKMMQCYSDGATIVVSEAHKKFAPLESLCFDFSRDFQMLCQANAYLSPAGNQGFHSHYDTHDVFVLQVAGRKKFQFYSAGVKLPFTEDTYTPEHNRESEMLDEIEVSAGDTLYIPRGIVHDAIADDGEPSLHITLGAYPFVMRDLLQEMIQVAAEGDVQWRSSVELHQQSLAFFLGNTNGSESNELNTNHLYKSAESIFTEPVYKEALSRLTDEVALAQSTVAIEVPQISLQSSLTVEPDCIYGVERTGSAVKLRLPGVVLCFESPMSDAVDAVLRNKISRVNEIPALNDEQKLALCHQLAGAGVIVIGD